MKFKLQIFPDLNYNHCLKPLHGVPLSTFKLGFKVGFTQWLHNHIFWGKWEIRTSVFKSVESFLLFCFCGMKTLIKILLQTNFIIICFGQTFKPAYFVVTRKVNLASFVCDEAFWWHLTYKTEQTGHNLILTSSLQFLALQLITT